jgi:signal transduction histidine kinase
VKRLARQSTDWLRRFAVVVLAALAPALATATTPPPISEPATAARVRFNTTLPPGDELPWEAVALPDARRPTLIGGQETAAWYRIEFNAAATTDIGRESWAAYIPYLRDGGRVFLNGRAVEHIAETSESLRVKWERPHLVSLPDNLLRQGRNVLMVRTKPRLDVGFPRLSFGPASELRRIQEWRSFWVLTLPQITIVCCLLVSLFTILIWAKRPSEQIYGLFGLTVLFWGLRTLTFVIETLPVEHWVPWRLVYHASTGGFVALLALFCARFARLHPRRGLWVALFAYWLICPVAMLVFGHAADIWMHRVWIAGFIPVSMAAAGMIFLAAWRQRSKTAYALLLALMLAVLTGIHDYLLIVGRLGTILPAWDGHRMFLMHHGANLMLLVMGGILAQRFVQVLTDLERLNQSLETRIAEREAQLEAQFQRAHTLERERATVEERRRIMQDMHDGLGSELFQALSRAERSSLTQNEMAASLRSCIDEMRLALEALGTTDDSFLDAIADFRFRWERQLGEAGVHSTWRIEADEDSLKFPPRTTLQYLRILQEALTNVLKHAGAAEVQIELAGKNGELRIRVEDDGVGMASGARGNGHGLRNMRRRADLLGAELEIASQPGRTSVELRAAAVPAPA